jgi:hypothetical protein
MKRFSTHEDKIVISFSFVHTAMPIHFRSVRTLGEIEIRATIKEFTSEPGRTFRDKRKDILVLEDLEILISSDWLPLVWEGKYYHSKRSVDASIAYLPWMKKRQFQIGTQIQFKCFVSEDLSEARIRLFQPSQLQIIEYDFSSSKSQLEKIGLL